jgi:hypothetical protein
MKNDETDKLEDNAKGLIDIILSCSLRKAYIDELFTRKIKKEIINPTSINQFEVEGINALKYILFLDFAQSIANVTYDDDDKSVSIKNIMKKLQRDDIKMYYLSKRTEIDINKIDIDTDSDSNTDKYFIELLTEDKKKHYDDVYNDLIKTWDIINEKAEYLKLKTLRDKVISHYELKNNNGKRRLIEISDIGVHWQTCIDLFNGIFPMTVNIYSFIFGSYYKLGNIITLQSNWAKSISDHFMESI